MRPKQIREPGRQQPYITIVDTGLAVAVQNLLMLIYLELIEGGDVTACLDEEGLGTLCTMLSDEIQNRTF